MLFPKIMVADLLRTFPFLAKLLLELRVDCVGCSMNKFCSLEDLDARYGLDLEQINLKIRENVDKSMTE